MKTLQIVLIALTAYFVYPKNTTTAPVINTNTGNTTMAANHQLTYLALGDSYTIGEAVPQAQSFPYQLVNLLNSNAFYVQPPTVIATTGFTADDLINAIAESHINKKFDFVTLLIGVNDQYQGLTETNYRVKFAQLLNTAINFANGQASRVFVLSIPDYGVTPFANGQANVISPQINHFNAINKAISQQAGVNYADITGISRQAAIDATLIAPDGLHPSGKMYKLWVRQLEPLVARRLK